MPDEPVTIDGDAEEVDEVADSPPGSVPDAAQADEIRDQLPAVRASEALVARSEMSPAELVAQSNKIKEVMALAMRPDVHYGVIPGTGTKPTLLKPGAEMLCVLLRLAPHYDGGEKMWVDGGHLIVGAKVQLVHIPTGLTVAEGEGMCSTLEEKYRYRNAKLLCPECGQPEVRVSRNNPGWYCWNNPAKGAAGCGANFGPDDTRISEQVLGKVENPNIADTYNTVVKMANKRALIAAILNGTAASDIFTQDPDDDAVAEQVRQTTTVPQPRAQRPGPAAGAQAAPAGTRMISDPQKGKISAIKDKLIAAGRMSEEQYRSALMADYQVESITALTSKQASHLIERLMAAEKQLEEKA